MRNVLLQTEDVPSQLLLSAEVHGEAMGVSHGARSKSMMVAIDRTFPNEMQVLNHCKDSEFYPAGTQATLCETTKRSKFAAETPS